METTKSVLFALFVPETKWYPTTIYHRNTPFFKIFKDKLQTRGPWALMRSHEINGLRLKVIYFGPMIMYTTFELNQMKTVGVVIFLVK